MYNYSFLQSERHHMIKILVTDAGSETRELEELETGHVNPEVKRQRKRLLPG